MAVIINREKCIKCRKCYERCPEESFGIDESGGVYVKYPEECWLCGSCEMDCPAGAIEVRYDQNSKPMLITGKRKEQNYGI